jgi:hypothetical protein
MLKRNAPSEKDEDKIIEKLMGVDLKSAEFE